MVDWCVYGIVDEYFVVYLLFFFCLWVVVVCVSRLCSVVSLILFGVGVLVICLVKWIVQLVVLIICLWVMFGCSEVIMNLLLLVFGFMMYRLVMIVIGFLFGRFRCWCELLFLLWLIEVMKVSLLMKVWCDCLRMISIFLVLLVIFGVLLVFGRCILGWWQLLIMVVLMLLKWLIWVVLRKLMLICLFCSQQWKILLVGIMVLVVLVNLLLLMDSGRMLGLVLIGLDLQISMMFGEEVRCVRLVVFDGRLMLMKYIVLLCRWWVVVMVIILLVLQLFIVCFL